MVRLMRFERTRVAPLPPEDSVSAISPQPHFGSPKEFQLTKYKLNSSLFATLFSGFYGKTIGNEVSRE